MISKFNVTLLIETSRKCGRELLRGVARYSRLHETWSISRTPPIYRTTSGRKKVVNLEKVHSDGIIFMEMASPEQILPTGFPAIAVDVKDQIFGLSNVVGDCNTIGEMAATHFLERGFKNFAFCGFDDIHWSRERGDAFCNYLEKTGHTVFRYKQPSTGKKRIWEKEKDHLGKWLRSLPHPVAIMACNDDRADNVLETCKDCQIKVPNEIAVLGVDNDDLVCDITEPPLSSIDMNFEKAGYEAAAVLDRWMKGETMANHVIVIHPTHVVVRQSTNILAIDDQEVAEAIRFINDHVRQPIQVVDVAENIAVSRRTLEKRFKAATGMSIGSQIRSKRVNYIANLLLETNLSISEIAYSMGFDGPANFSRFFQKEFHMKPSQYRKV